MAKIICLDKYRERSAPRDVIRGAPGSAQVYLFDGIRYERYEHNPKAARPVENAKPKRQQRSR
ncbi:MAG: hypothetical protein AAGG69_02235 [Pseudomonadota bacterium]